jgi:hypothetical protein
LPKKTLSEKKTLSLKLKRRKSLRITEEMLRKKYKIDVIKNYEAFY